MERKYKLDGEEIEMVTSFMFLGSVIEIEGKCDMEIKRRVAIGKAAMNGLEKIWKDKHKHRHEKKIGEGPDHTNGNIRQWDMRNVDMEEDAENIMDGKND